MSLSRESAASLALYLAIAHPGVFDAYAGTLPGALSTLGRYRPRARLGYLGDDDSDDTSDDSSDDLAFDTSDDDADYENSDGSLQLLSTGGTDLDSSDQVDDSNVDEDLRELGVATPSDTQTDSATYGGTVTPVPGSAADTGNLGVVPGSSADPLSQTVDVSDVPLPTIDEATPAIQSISSSNAVQSIGAPAVQAVASALTSPSALQALANTTTAYLNNQALAGEEQTALQSQANNLNASLQMAAIDHPATGVTYVTGANGQQEAVVSNAATGAPLVGADGAYVPASTAAGILSAITSSSALGPVLIIGGIGLLLLLLLGHHGHSGGGGASSGGSAPRAPRSPRFIEVE